MSDFGSPLGANTGNGGLLGPRLAPFPDAYVYLILDGESIKRDNTGLLPGST
jgi:hypothetical protein